MNRDSIKRLYSKGEKRFVATMINLINEGEITENDFSLKALYDGIGAPDLRKAKIIENRHITEKDVEITEALSTTAFPKITGALINKVVQQSYDLEYGIGDQLVTVIPSSVRDETVVGFSADMELKEVPEGMEYEEGSFGEKYHKIKNTKKGRIISLTEEMIKFDQTGQMVLQAKRVGEYAKSAREKIILNAVLELTSSGDLAAWRPAGTATTLYSNTSTDPYSDDTLDNLGSEALADETDLDTAMALFSKFTDENGIPIHVNPKVLLVGVSLRGVANKICYSGQAVEKTVPAGSKNIYTGTKVLATAFIDQELSTTAWFIGDPKKQFVYTEVFPLQVLQAKAGNSDEFKKDIIYSFKARLYGGAGAITNRYMVKGNA